MAKSSKGGDEVLRGGFVLSEYETQMQENSVSPEIEHVSVEQVQVVLTSDDKFRESISSKPAEPSFNISDNYDDDSDAATNPFMTHKDSQKA